MATSRGGGSVSEVRSAWGTWNRFSLESAHVSSGMIDSVQSPILNIMGPRGSSREFSRSREGEGLGVVIWRIPS